MARGEKYLQFCLAKRERFTAFQKIDWHGLMPLEGYTVHLAYLLKTSEYGPFAFMDFKPYPPGFDYEWVSKNMVQVAVRVDEPYGAQFFLINKLAQRIAFFQRVAAWIKNGALARVVPHDVGVLSKRVELESLDLGHVIDVIVSIVPIVSIAMIEAA